MHRTSILLPEDLKKAAERAAKARGLSLGALIRRQLQQVVDSVPHKQRSDPLFDDFRPYTGKGGSDLAERHDNYLYDDE